jgi:hypothetical protein
MAPATALPLRLRTRRTRMLLLLVACSAFVAGGVFLLPTNRAAAVAAIVFFGLGAAVGVALSGTGAQVGDAAGRRRGRPARHLRSFRSGTRRPPQQGARRAEPAVLSVDVIERLPSKRVALSLASVAIVLLAGSAARAFAGDADPPAVKVGDQWKFAAYYSVRSAEPNRVWTVTAVTPTAIEGTENGEPLVLTPDLGTRESPRDRYSNQRLLSFPLAVGKRWRYDTDWLFKAKGSSGTLSVDVEVVATERVLVPAGEFDTYKLVAVAKLGGTSPIGSVYAGEITSTYWYAPRARAIVKSVQRNPYLGPSGVELVELRLQP